jgi:hypothetical protein
MGVLGAEDYGLFPKTDEICLNPLEGPAGLSKMHEVTDR